MCVFVCLCVCARVCGCLEGRSARDMAGVVLNIRVGTELCLKGTEPSMGWKEGRAGSAHTAQLSLEKIYTEPDGTTSLPPCPGLLLPLHSSAL